jgi:hypothetical protein
VISEVEHIARGLGGTKSGSGWKARCPAHNDTEPSLSVSEGTNGKLLVKCHAGCSFEDIKRALEHKGLWPKKGNGRDCELPAHVYRDADGLERFGKIRNAPGREPRFLFTRPDGNGGWLKPRRGILKDVDTSILYRIDEVNEAIAQGRTIAVAEGEKDCDNLWRIGIPATCNAHGGSKGKKPKWTEKHSAQLKDADIVVFNDNDATGYAHADAVCKLSLGVAKSVRRLDLKLHWPDMWEKADVSDWLEKGGGTREKLDELMASSPLYASEAPSSAPAAVRPEDFYAYLPQHNYIYLPTYEPWPASSVDAQLGDGTSEWLDCNRAVVQMTWAPGLPMLVNDRVVDAGGWIEKRGVTIFNLYRPPTIVHGDAARAGPWVDHVRKIYPADADHIIKYLAHRVQRPQEKICHGLVLGGAPGIGKDTLIEPVKRAVGPWNVAEVSPQQMLGRFNGFVKCVILRVSEARDLGEMNRFALYEHMKVYLASPPDVIRCDEKHLREHSVFNVMGVIITSNRKDSFFLPADDRRHYVAWTDAAQEDFEDGYWRTIWNWYDSGGDGHVAAYLAQLDLSDFNPKAPPPKTDAFWEIVETNRTPENSELADAIDALGNPNAVTLGMIRQKTTGDFLDWISDRRNSRQIPHRMSECGYVSIRNAAAKDGQWVVSGKRQAVYVRAELSIRDRHEAAWSLAAAQQELRGPDR